VLYSRTVVHRAGPSQQRPRLCCLSSPRRCAACRVLWAIRRRCWVGARVGLSLCRTCGCACTRLLVPRSTRA